MKKKRPTESMSCKPEPFYTYTPNASYYHEPISFDGVNITYKITETMKPSIDFKDATRENAHRLKREKILKSTNRLDKHEHLQGIAIAAFVGLAIAIILFSVFYPALNYAIDNIPPGIWTIFVLAGVAGIIIFRSAKRSMK